ncbi:MAG: GTPase, partial [Candidatus Baltobacteraceae bacterium]
VAVDARAPRSVARVGTAIAHSPAGRKRARGIARAMVVGIPNSGKSSIINALVGRSAAKTEDRAGVTRQLQWFRLSRDVELMDTPGVLPPKIGGSASQWKLALCGAVPRALYDPAEVAEAFYRWLVGRHPRTNVPSLQAFAAARGFMRRGGEVDYHNAAQSYIRAFNEGAFGRISLESPDDVEAA